MHISKQQARLFLLKKQLLYPPKNLSGKNAVEKVFQTLRVIQYDPLNPCGRNTDLVLQSRITDYHPEDYFDWLYTERKGIECDDKELCIIPIEDFSLTFHAQTKTGRNPRVEKFLKTYKKSVEDVLLQIEKGGPITSSDILEKARVEDGWGGASVFGRIALDILWKTGRLVITKRVRGRKYYDLAQRVYGEKHAYMTGQEFPIKAEHILRRIMSVGILPKSGSGSGWQGIGSAKENAEIITTLLKEKKLVEAQVEDIKQPYVILATDKKLLDEKEEESVDKKMVFIAPLDTLMWDRQMIENFFGFEYRWEVYAPLAKRKFGYYVLPILYGDEFVGRIEPVYQNKKLVIKNIWYERKWDKELKDAYKKAILDFNQYLSR